MVSCPLLLDLASYYPDTEDLLQNKDAREYWLQCFEDATEKVGLLALLAIAVRVVYVLEVMVVIYSVVEAVTARKAEFPSLYFQVPSSERSSELGSPNSEIYGN